MARLCSSSHTELSLGQSWRHATRRSHSSPSQTEVKQRSRPHLYLRQFNSAAVESTKTHRPVELSPLEQRLICSMSRTLPLESSRALLLRRQSSRFSQSLFLARDAKPCQQSCTTRQQSRPVMCVILRQAFLRVEKEGAVNASGDALRDSRCKAKQRPQLRRLASSCVRD